MSTSGNQVFKTAPDPRRDFGRLLGVAGGARVEMLDFSSLCVQA
jgi:hypothetical protein